MQESPPSIGRREFLALAGAAVVGIQTNTANALSREPIGLLVRDTYDRVDFAHYKENWTKRDKKALVFRAIDTDETRQKILEFIDDYGWNPFEEVNGYPRDPNREWAQDILPVKEFPHAEFDYRKRVWKMIFTGRGAIRQVTSILKPRTLDYFGCEPWEEEFGMFDWCGDPFCGECMDMQPDISRPLSLPH